MLWLLFHCRCTCMWWTKGNCWCCHPNYWMLESSFVFTNTSELPIFEVPDTKKFYKRGLVIYASLWNSSGTLWATFHQWSTWNYLGCCGLQMPPHNIQSQMPTPNIPLQMPTPYQSMQEPLLNDFTSHDHNSLLSYDSQQSSKTNHKTCWMVCLQRSAFARVCCKRDACFMIRGVFIKLHFPYTQSLNKRQNR